MKSGHKNMTEGAKKKDYAGRPYLFTFWQSSGQMPEYIRLCMETQKRNFAGHYRHIHLDFESCLDWVPERDWLWDRSVPASEGRSSSKEGRRWALFTGMLRIALLQRHGGCWVDVDTLVFPQFGRLRKLHRACEVVVAEGAGGLLANSLISVRRRSPFMRVMWQAIQGKLREKEQNGDALLGWGELGFRLLRKKWTTQGTDSGFVLPYGMFLNFDSSQASPLFTSSPFVPSELHVNAIAVSVLNNSIESDVRGMSASELCRADTMFARSFAYAMGEDGIYQRHLSRLSAGQLLSVNRAGVMGRSMADQAEKNAKQRELRTKLARRNRELTKLRGQPGEAGHSDKA